MKTFLWLVLTFCACGQSESQESLDSQFYVSLLRIEAEYRTQKAEVLKKADRVVVYLVDFDGITDGEEFADEEKFISIAPYRAKTRILSSKEVEPESHELFLTALSKQIAKSEHTGGADCHYPIHGVRIYDGETLLHEGTFCWVCGNFSFSYPQGSGWLDTSTELAKIFLRLLPIPEAELKRFNTKYPNAKP